MEAARATLEWYRKVPPEYSVFSTKRVTMTNVIVIQDLVFVIQGRHGYNSFITVVQKCN